MEDVTILIPTYFAGKMLSNCMESIYSTAVRSPQILVYKNDIGWVKAANEMMQSVKGDILLLNDDTIVVSDIITEMKKLAYSSHDIGIVGGKALSSVNPSTIINYGIHVGLDGNTAHKHFGQPRDSVEVENQKAVEGSCIYIKRTFLDRIGYFDEAYSPAYREEVDLCFRGREAGWKVVSCPTAEYIHLVSQTNMRLGITNDTHEYFMSKWSTKLKLGLV